MLSYLLAGIVKKPVFVFGSLSILSLIVFSVLNMNSATISGTGTLRYLNIEGGFYAIFSDDGGHYDPINLPKEFEVDGLRVEFTGFKRGHHPFHMWGEMIYIVGIWKIS